MNESSGILTYLLKDEVDFKQLKKYGFIKSWDGFYVILDKDNFIEVSVNPITKIIETEENNFVLKRMITDELVYCLGQTTIFNFIEEER